MKKYGALLLILFAFSFSGCGDPCKESPLTKLGDSIATLGKSGIDKDKILVERAAQRAAKCGEKKAGEVTKKLGF